MTHSGEDIFLLVRPLPLPRVGCFVLIHFEVSATDGAFHTFMRAVLLRHASVFCWRVYKFIQYLRGFSRVDHQLLVVDEYHLLRSAFFLVISSAIFRSFIGGPLIWA